MFAASFNSFDREIFDSEREETRSYEEEKILFTEQFAREGGVILSPASNLG
jgi:hypothetical protein